MEAAPQETLAVAPSIMQMSLRAAVTVSLSQSTCCVNRLEKTTQAPLKDGEESAPQSPTEGLCPGLKHLRVPVWLFPLPPPLLSLRGLNAKAALGCVITLQ